MRQTKILRIDPLFIYFWTHTACTVIGYRAGSLRAERQSKIGFDQLKNNDRLSEAENLASSSLTACKKGLLKNVAAGAACGAVVSAEGGIFLLPVLFLIATCPPAGLFLATMPMTAAIRTGHQMGYGMYGFWYANQQIDLEKSKQTSIVLRDANQSALTLQNQESKNDNKHSGPSM